MNEIMHKWMSEIKNEWKNEIKHEIMNEIMHKWMNGWIQILYIVTYSKKLQYFSISLFSLKQFEALLQKICKQMFANRIMISLIIIYLFSLFSEGEASRE